MNDDFFREFSSSAQRALRLLANKPEDAVHLHQRVTVIHGAIMIGREILEHNAKNARDENELRSNQMAAMACLGVTTALELCMAALLELHPELGKMNLTRPPEPKSPFDGAPRLRRLDLD